MVIVFPSNRTPCACAVMYSLGLVLQDGQTPIQMDPSGLLFYDGKTGNHPSRRVVHASSNTSLRTHIRSGYWLNYLKQAYSFSVATKQYNYNNLRTVTKNTS